MPQPDDDTLAFLAHCGLRKLDATRLAVLEQFRLALETANLTTNLTRLVTPAEFWTKHVADSLAVALVWPALLSAHLRVADVGCGAGFPLAPLAWANPELRLCGIEPKQRKAQFVLEAARLCGWSNCTVLARQAREVGRLPDYAGSFDLVLTRAVGSAAAMLREARGLLRPDPDAAIIVYKTPETIIAETAEAEREADKFGFALTLSSPIDLPSQAGRRQFAIFRRSS